MALNITIRPRLALHFVPDTDGTLSGMHEAAELTARGDLSATIGRRCTLDERPQACTVFGRLHTAGGSVADNFHSHC
jgi:hypothetical protein